jgi:hypothetical protein
VTGTEGKPVRVTEAPTALVELNWAPNGKYLAYSWVHQRPKVDVTSGRYEGDERSGVLGVCDSDGSNPRTVVSEVVPPSKEALSYQFGLIGWK